MAVAVYISNEKNATEVAVDNISTKEVALVGSKFPGAVPVKFVNRTIPNVKIVKIVGIRWITQGEIL